METITTRDGRRLAFQRRGRGPTIVCHPGGPGFGGDVFGDLGGLDRYCELVLVDPRGTGASDPPAGDDYGLDGYVEDLVDLVAALGERPTAVLGHSHGGLVALRYGAEPGATTAHLIVVGSPSYVEDPADDRHDDGAPVAGEVGRGDADPGTDTSQRLGPRDAGPRPRTGRSTTAGGEHGAPDAEMVSWGVPTIEYEPALTEEVIEPEPLEFFNDVEIDAFDLRAVLPSVTVPTLVVCGRDDDVAGPDASYELTSALPTAQLSIIEGSGHVPFLENPAAFREAVLDYLGDLVQR